MKKKCCFRSILYWILALGPFVLTLSFYPFLPEEVPINYNFDGVVDRISSRTELILIGFILSLITISFRLLLLIGKKDPNYQHQRKIMVCIFSFVGLIYTSLILFIILAALDAEFFNEFDIFFIISLLLSLFYIFIGRLLPGIKRNHILGVRTPWTLKSESVWQKTHHFSSKVFMIAGLISAVIICFLEGICSIIFVLAVLLIMANIVTIYSYYQYKNEKATS